MMIEKIYRRIRVVYPKKYLKWIDNNLKYAGMETKVDKFTTLSLLYAFAISLLIFSILFSLGHYLVSYIVFGAGFVGLQIIFNLFVVMIGERRGSFAESVLPDALQLMSANIRSGLTPDKALLFSARPEFGVLEKEIKLAASKAVAGEPIEESLLSLGSKIKSKIINRTFALIVEGMKKGGEIASLLEQTSEDIRDLKLLKKEISAQVGMYAIFIFIAIGFAAPLLFAFTSHLVTTMSNIGSELNIGEASDFAAIGPLKMGIMKISPDFLKIFSLATLSITSIFGSLLIGLLQDGKEMAGVKYIPILLGLDMGIYFVTKIVLAGLIGTIAPTSALPV